MFIALRTSLPVMLAVVFVLLRGRVVGRPWDLLDTALVTFVIHAVLTDVGTLAEARRQRFKLRTMRLGPFNVDLVKSGQLALVRPTGALATAAELAPTGTVDLPARLARVGVAGLLPSALLFAAAVFWFLTEGAVWWSHPGAAVFSSLFVVITHALPSFPSMTGAGTSLERWRQPRWVLANWTWAAVLEAVVAGRSLSEVAAPELLAPLLPPEPSRVEPIVIVWLVALCERGDFSAVRARLEAHFKAPNPLPSWLAVDLMKQAGALAALIDKDLPAADACLDRVRELQQVPWYEQLLVAAIAHAKGDAEGQAAALKLWNDAVSTHPLKGLLLGGNAWILQKISA